MTPNRNGKRHSKLRIKKQVADGVEPLSQEWVREINRRVRDSQDPIRYLIASEIGRQFVFYYNVSTDSFAVNEPEGGTLFKRRELAERVKQLLGRHYATVKFTMRDGRLERLSPSRRRRA